MPETAVRNYSHKKEKELKARIFNQLCSIAREKAGINLKEGKEALVEARVSKRIRALKLSDAESYLEYLKKDSTGEELVSFLDAVSTNYTSFMREREHFDELGKIAANYDFRRHGPMKIWCCAAATGEEPYTIAITLMDSFQTKGYQFKILATDISTKALNAAIEGKYSLNSLEAFTKSQRIKYFQKAADKSDKEVQVSLELKKNIVFRRLNLATPPFPMKGPLDVVFCRNVMIYFDNTVRQPLISEIERLLAPGGILFTGHSETLTGINTNLKMIRPSIYRKRES